MMYVFTETCRPQSWVRECSFTTSGPCTTNTIKCGVRGQALETYWSRRPKRSCEIPWTQIPRVSNSSRTTSSGIFLPRFLISRLQNYPPEEISVKTHTLALIKGLLLHIFRTPKKRKTKNLLDIWPTGTGKPKWASENFKDIYWKDDTKWWDARNAHETIVIDNFCASHMKFNFLLCLLDGYPYRCEIKGGFRWFSSKNIIIITNRKPSDKYQLPDEDIQQLKRRIRSHN